MNFTTGTTRTMIAWLPVVLLPCVVVLLAPANWPGWAFMWLLAGALFVGCKWLTWQTASPASASWARHLGYLWMWPGLDATTFLSGTDATRPTLAMWLFAVGKFLLGIFLILGVFPAISQTDEQLRGWVGMIGIVFVLHFGFFHLASLMWRSLGVQAKPLMNWPVLAQSVSEFWSVRWNTAFRDLTHRFLFRPLTVRLGGRAAIAVGFLVSGLIHELVISVPAQAGYGGPTLFFLIQAGALFLERSDLGRWLGLGQGVRGWLFTMLVLLGTVLLLFHPPFVRTIVVPFLDWLVLVSLGSTPCTNIYRP